MIRYPHMAERPAKTVVISALLAMTSMLAALPAAAVDWPQEISADEGTIVVYQPQPEKLSGNTLSGRSAMALQLKGGGEPIFGAFWFEARIDTDRDQGLALIRDVRVTDVRWPDSKDADEQRFTAIVEAAIPENGFEISMEQLSSSLASAEIEQESLANLKNDPPVIPFRESLAVLLIYDAISSKWYRIRTLLSRSPIPPLRSSRRTNPRNSS